MKPKNSTKRQFWKRFFVVFGVVVLLSLFFRGPIFRLLVTYESVGIRSIPTTGIKATSAFFEEKSVQNPTTSPDEMADEALSVTASLLSFSTGKCSNSPEQLLTTKKANCIGYAAFCAAYLNFQLAKNKLQNEWRAEAHIGKLSFLGFDIHQLFTSAFFKDHDFVLLRNLQTGETLALDPTVYDYFWISRLSVKE